VIRNNFTVTFNTCLFEFVYLYLACVGVQSLCIVQHVSAGLTMVQVVRLWTWEPHNFTAIIFIHTYYIKKLRQLTDQYIHLEICIKQKPQFYLVFFWNTFCFKISPIFIIFCQYLLTIDATINGIDFGHIIVVLACSFSNYFCPDFPLLSKQH